MPDASAAANRAASPPASRTRGRHPTRVVSRRLTADELYNIEQLSDIATRKGWRSFKMHEAEVTLPAAGSEPAAAEPAADGGSEAAESAAADSVPEVAEPVVVDGVPEVAELVAVVASAHSEEPALATGSGVCLAQRGRAA